MTKSAAILIAVLALICLASGVVADTRPFFFVQLADPQLGFTTGNADMVAEIDHFTRAVATINRLKPAFVLICGDMTHKPHDPTQIRAFWRVAREISPDIPLRLLPGNHDVAGGTAAAVKSYRRLFGEDRYSFSHNGSKFIVLNTSLFGRSADAALRDGQRKWFEEELSAAHAAGANHIFVCSHHPWFLDSPDEPGKYQNVPMPYRQDYLETMNRHKVKYALAGHLHYHLVVRNGGLTIVAGIPLSKSFAKPPVVGVTIWKVYPDRVEREFYSLEEVPASIKL